MEVENEADYKNTLDTFCSWRMGVDGIAGVELLANRDKFVKLASLHFAIVLISPMADQLRDGLKTYDVSNSKDLITINRTGIESIQLCL